MGPNAWIVERPQPMATAVNLDRARLPRSLRIKLERIDALQAEARAAESQTEQDDEGQPIAAAPPPPVGEGAPTPPPPPPADPTLNAPPQADLKPFHDPALGTDPRAADPMYWRNRLSVMQGKLLEERRAADAREAALNAKIFDLEGQIKALKTQAPAPVDVKSMFTPEQLEALGEDQAAAIATAAVTAARTHVDVALTEQRTTAQQRQERDEEQAQARRRRDFLDKLEEVVPNWATIDKRADWLTWLAQIDPLTNADRQSSLTAGIHASDVAGVASIFNEFLRTLTPRTAPPQPPVTAPGGAGTPAAPVAASRADLSQTPPTKAEINAYYKDAALNKVSEAEKIAFEKRLALL
jgi:hypothetical protein